jgi:hypothetical protein
MDGMCTDLRMNIRADRSPLMKFQDRANAGNCLLKTGPMVFAGCGIVQGFVALRLGLRMKRRGYPARMFVALRIGLIELGVYRQASLVCK